MPRRKDPMTNPISELLGNRFLIEQHGKKFIVTSLKPRRRKKSSRAQLAYQRRFKLAVAQARNILKIPKLKAAYMQNLNGNRNAYQAVIADCMKGKARVVK